MTNTWTTNADGSLSFNGTVDFAAGTSLASGAGIVIFGPNGGTANFPAATLTGPAGLSPTITATTVVLDAGSTVPSPNPAVVFTAATDSTPPNYAFTFYTLAGTAGTDGALVILSATDLTGTPQAGYTIGYSPAVGGTAAQAEWTPMLNGNYYYGAFGATASTTAAQKELGSVTVSAPYDFWPKISAQANVIGAADTRVDLVARVGSTTGPICGYGYGQAGATPCPVVAFENGLEVGSDNIVSAGEVTIFLMLENQTASSNAWSGTASNFLQVIPIGVPA